MYKLYDKTLSFFERVSKIPFLNFLDFVRFIYAVLIGSCLMSVIKSEALSVSTVIGFIVSVVMLITSHFWYRQELKRLLICQKLNDGLTKLFNK